MELLQLQYFRTVAKLEHMTKAAQQLHIAQPALSKTIARLEEHVGVPLFDRQGRHIRLNTFGKTFLNKVEAALTLLEEGQKEVAELAGMEHRSVHLATSTLDRLSEPLGEFLDLYPDINFRITQAQMDEMEQLVENGDVDLCFTALPIDRPGICAVPVLNEEVYLAVPPGHRLADRKSAALSEVAEEPFIGYKETALFQQLNDPFFREAGFTPNFVCRVDEPSAIASLVRAGLGVALVGNCGGPNTPFHMLHIEEPVCQRSFQLAWHEKKYLSLAARRFRDFVAEYFARTNQEAPGESKPRRLAL